MYVHDQEVESFDWLKNNGVDFGIYGPMIHGDGRVSETLFCGAGFRVRNRFFKDDETIENGYIYLRYLNVIRKEVVVTPGTDEMDNLSNYSHLFVNENKIYNNGGSEIYL